MRDKKGLSTIITTLIIILLVIVAIGMIWVVVRNVLESGASSINPSVDCLSLDIGVTSAACDSSANCNAVVKRNPGGKAISGIKVIFSNSTTFGSIVNVAGANLDELEQYTVLAASATGGVKNSTPTSNKVEVTPYFTDDSGVEQLCTQTTTKSF